MKMEFNAVLAQAVSRVAVKEEIEVIVRDIKKALGVEFFGLTVEELLDIAEAEKIRRTEVGEFMRAHIAQLKEEREKALVLALTEGKLVSSVKISEGLKSYIETFWQRGYTTRAIEEVLGVSDSTISRYTRGLAVVKEGKKRGQVIEVLGSLEDLNLQEFRKCQGTSKSYINTAKNRPYTISEIETIKTMTRVGYSAQDIGEEIGRKSTAHIIQYMKKAFTEYELEALESIDYSFRYASQTVPGRFLRKYGMDFVIACYERNKRRKVERDGSYIKAR